MMTMPFPSIHPIHPCKSLKMNFRNRLQGITEQPQINTLKQGGRTWQAFGGGKHGHETFRQARNYNFRDKCVVFARNLKFSNLTQ